MMSILSPIVSDAPGDVALIAAGSTDVHLFILSKNNITEFMEVKHIQSYQGLGTKAKTEGIFERIFSDIGPNVSTVVAGNSMGHLGKKVTVLSTQEATSISELAVRESARPMILTSEKRVAEGKQQKVVPVGFNSMSDINNSYLVQFNKAAMKFKKSTNIHLNAMLISTAGGAACVAGAIFSASPLFMVGTVAAVGIAALSYNRYEPNKKVYLEIRNSKAPIEGPSWAYGKFTNLNADEKVVMYDAGGRSMTSYTGLSDDKMKKHKSVNTNKFLEEDNKDGWIEAVVQEMPKDGTEAKIYFTGELRNTNRQDWIDSLNDRFRTDSINASAELLSLQEEAEGHAAVMQRMLNPAALESKKAR